MITTVSVSTVTTVMSMAVTGLTAAFSMGAGALLLSLLATKELTPESGSGFASRLGRFVTIGITPLFIGFGVILSLKLFQIMS